MLYVSTRRSVSAAGYLFAILVGCLALYMLVIQQRTLPDPRPSGTLDQSVLSKIGLIPRGHTVVLALRTSCEYCTRSVPFYRDLLDTYRESEVVHITAVFPDDAGVATAYLRVQQLEVPAVTDQPLAALKVVGTPTVLILDSQGRILRAWVGLLPREGEAEVKTMLASLGPEQTTRR